MEIAERTGLINRIAKVLMPFTRFLFPAQKDPETISCIIMSFMANIFGAGNSSTVFALRTMERLDVTLPATICVLLQLSTWRLHRFSRL